MFSLTIEKDGGGGWEQNAHILKFFSHDFVEVHERRVRVNDKNEWFFKLEGFGERSDEERNFRLAK